MLCEDILTYLSETTITSAMGKMRGKPRENHIFRPTPLPILSEDGHIFAHPERERETVRKKQKNPEIPP